MSKYGDLVERSITKQIDEEIVMGGSNQSGDNDDFQAAVDMLDNSVTASNYSWQSKIRIPEFTSILLTGAAMAVGQYFVDRDFVEVFIEDPGDEAQAAARANQELQNRTLNRRDLYFFQKFVRSLTTNNIGGKNYALCWWEQKLKTVKIGSKKVLEEQEVDVVGEPVEGPGQKITEVKEVVKDIYGTRPVIDRFNFDLVDQRNVFTDNTYTYSLQDKRYVTIRREMTIADLYAEKEREGYFNLDQLVKSEEGETDTARESYNKDGEHTPVPLPMNTAVDRYWRFGKYWCVVERDEKGNPVRDKKRGWIKVSPGVDQFGEPLEGAELLEMKLSYASPAGGNGVLIGFYLNPYRDAHGLPFRPVIRGLCYIHPTKDGGMGDGTLARDLQTAVDDTFNVNQDRTLLATMPTFVGRKYALEDTDSVYFEPGHMIEASDPIADLREIAIRDNITGGLQQLQLLSNKMQQLTAVYPTTMGDVPSISSTTATAVAEAGNRSDTRSNYKALSFEHTFLTELYWMITQMTNQFAHPETGFRLMGDKIYDFDPTLDYTYKPVSQAIETEYSKAAKLRVYQTLFGQIVPIEHPNKMRMVNYMLEKMFSLLGDDYANFGKKLFDETVQPAPQGGAQAPPGMGMAGGAMSNQNGVAMSGAEEVTREGGYDV